MNQKSQKYIATSGVGRNEYKSSLATVTNQAQVASSSSHLKIKSARQDIVSTNLGGAGCHSTKNVVPAFKSKLQSKYGQNAQNSIIARESLTNG